MKTHLGFATSASALCRVPGLMLSVDAIYEKTTLQSRSVPKTPNDRRAKYIVTFKPKEN